MLLRRGPSGFECNAFDLSSLISFAPQALCFLSIFIAPPCTRTHPPQVARLRPLARIVSHARLAAALRFGSTFIELRVLVSKLRVLRAVLDCATLPYCCNSSGCIRSATSHPLSAAAAVRPGHYQERTKWPIDLT
jgi:hypothetical protein